MPNFWLEAARASQIQLQAVLHVSAYTDMQCVVVWEGSSASHAICYNHNLARVTLGELLTKHAVQMHQLRARALSALQSTFQQCFPVASRSSLFDCVCMSQPARMHTCWRLWALL